MARREREPRDRAAVGPVQRVAEELERAPETETVCRGSAHCAPPKPFSREPGAAPRASIGLCPGTDPAQTARRARAVAGRIAIELRRMGEPRRRREFYDAVACGAASERGRQKAARAVWVTEAPPRTDTRHHGGVGARTLHVPSLESTRGRGGRSHLPGAHPAVELHRHAVPQAGRAATRMTLPELPRRWTATKPLSTLAVTS